VLEQKRAWTLGYGGPPTDFCPPHQKELADRRYDIFYDINKEMGVGGIASSVITEKYRLDDELDGR